MLLGHSCASVSVALVTVTLESPRRVHGLKLGNTAPSGFATPPSNHIGAAVGGVLGSAAFIGLGLAAFLSISRRRRRRIQKVDNGFGTFMDAPSKASSSGMTLP
ncbi:hypothetical protein PGT21_029975 [Puccinia graminis f. sp. tritici]|uniref:Uncharacterized protein n=1 Tax=Puccinia graminis f. sp. tritici TaxID=56615 RepID=A0A5B0PHQ6_PUCGR|nr:hypothetical protein PGT21_029975 [Puccinia graminis f. sp. tritici]KAA1120704.1 hypothetical protein PGTUg99_024246 [Puccinia graminis f. sp. tritici]